MGEPSAWSQRFIAPLQKSARVLGGGIRSLLSHRALDPITLGELEDLLIEADIGLDMATELTDALRAKTFDPKAGVDPVLGELSGMIAQKLASVARPLTLKPRGEGVNILLFAGVNGVGKTTTIGKLALRWVREGRKVVLAAGDTFRAAATEQLSIWAERAGAELVSDKSGSDPASLLFKAIKHTEAIGADILLIDTAGRLQNKDDLMAELSKMVRVAQRFDPQAPHHRILVLDATTGRNMGSQMEHFIDSIDLTGVVITKLDGSAKGGALLGVVPYNLPVFYVGLGENQEDLTPFDARAFSEALTGLSAF